MSKDWAKHLHDAGFPGVDALDSRPGSPSPDRAHDRGGENRAPTLSELIAACPKEIGTATFVLGSSQGGARWTATYFDFRNSRMVDDDALCQSGDTPEEAVAKLWLATHE